MKDWIKKKLGITRLEEDNYRLRSRLVEAEQFIDSKLAELKEYTRVDADIGIRGNNTIILTGVFNKKAYVRFYDMGDGQFKNLVHQLKDMQRHSLIRHIDEPTNANMRGMFDI